MGMRVSKELEAKILEMAGDPVKAPPKPHDEPNKLEAAYMQRLDDYKTLGEIREYGFQRIKLKVGKKKCWYTPDFDVLAIDGVIEFHETKGFMRDDARVKLQAAAWHYPQFRFFLVKREKSGRWDIERI